MFQRKLQFLLLICICTSIRAEEIPNCDYFDTVDLTYSEKLANGSYVYEKVEIPPETTGTYNYKILFEGKKISVEEHLRGCVCKFKPCIRYCCHRHRLDPADERKCTSELNDYQVNITLENGTQLETSIRDQFVVQPGIRIECKNENHIGPFTHNDDYKLFENGTLYRSNNIGYLSKRDYCIQPEELANKGFNYMLLPLNCINDYTDTYVKLVSAFFLLLTACVYIFGLHLQYVYDKCYLSYLLSLVASMLTHLLIQNETFLFGSSCYFLAYLSYFFSISTYIWHAAVALALWRVLVVDMYVISQHNNPSRFRKYGLYVWSMSSVLLLITILADQLLGSLDIDFKWKVGYLNCDCFLKLIDWSGVLYLFAPAALMILINITLIIATVWGVHIENRKNREHLKEQKYIKNNLILTFYLRIFLIAFVGLLVEPFLFVSNLTFNPHKYLSYIRNFLHLTYCTLTLAITVTRRDVMQLLTRRTYREDRTAR